MTNQNNDKSKNGKRIALILVALLLIAAIAFGAYTYSKYVTSGEGSGDATVAKWGFNMSITDNSANGGDEFGFANDYSSSGTAQNSEDSAVISASADSTNIVAPGASGGLSFTIGSGTSEVQAALTAELARSSHIFITLTSGDNIYTYSPIAYSLNGQATATGYDNVETAINGLSDDSIAPGETITGAGTYNIVWEWEYEPASVTLVQTAGSGGNVTLTEDMDINKLHTVLGTFASDVPDEAPKVTLNGATYTVSVTSGEYNLKESISLTMTVEQTGITG